MSRNDATRPSRRQFLATAATAAAATTILPRHVLGGPGFVAPSDKVNIGVIGVGGQGRTNCRALFQQDDAQIIAVADVAEEWDLSPYYYRGMAGRGPVRAEIEKHYSAKTPNFQCAEYVDFRDMLEEEKDLDAVLIATPDHSHAYISIVAMKAGKHVYCEKPLTLTVWEGRQVAQVAKETGVATQLGNHGRSSEGHRQVAEWIWDGAIGQVQEVHAWASAGWFADGRGRPEGTPPVPPGLDWDKWLGPAEDRPYHPEYTPFNWRGWWAFGGGGLPDVAVHHLDPAFNALELDNPETIEATAPWVDDEVASTGVLCTWRFGPRRNMAPVSVHWYDGGLRPPAPVGIDPNDPRQRMGEGGNGIYYVGEKGVITSGGWSGMPRLLPRELNRSYTRPEKTLPRVEGGHHASWLRACKGGEPASSNFEYSARLCEFVLLGIVAVRSKKQLRWYGPNMTVTNVPEANQYLKAHYREGWELPV